MFHDRKFGRHKGILFGILIAVNLVLCPMTGFYLLEANRPEFDSVSSEQDTESGYYPGGYACDPTAIGPFPWRQGPDDAEACKEARERHRLQETDLIQQKRAANAAESGVFFTHFQTVLAIFGLAFGILTFVAAGAAAYYARRAAVATENTADIAREIGQAQVRPYLTIDEASIEPEINDRGVVTWIVSVKVRNSGQSPARRGAIVITGRDFERSSEDQTGDMAAGQVVKLNGVLKSADDAIRWRRDELSAEVEVQINLIYFDVFSPDSSPHLDVWMFAGYPEMVSGRKAPLFTKGTVPAKANPRDSL